MRKNERVKISAFPITVPIICLTLLILAIIAFYSPITINSQTINRKVYSTKHLVIVLSGIFSLLVGYWLSVRNQSKVNVIQFRDYSGLAPHLLKLGRIFVIISICAHLIWFFYAFSRGQLIFTGYNYLPTIPGITTWTESGYLGVLLIIIFKSITPNQASNSRILIAVYLILILIRIVLNNERLALFTIVVPIVVWKLISSRFSNLKRIMSMFRLTSFILLIFLTGEWFRSWQSYRFRFNGNYLQFIWERFANYFLTAFNNGAAYYDFIGTKTVIPQVVGEAFTPLFPSFDAFSSYDLIWTKVLRFQVGYQEFNNINPILGMAGDLSTPVAIVLLFIVGWYLGFVYKKCVHGDLTSQIWYSILSITLLDLGRTYWWSHPRFLPVIICVIYVHYYIKRI